MNRLSGLLRNPIMETIARKKRAGVNMEMRK